jgi:hypothetical protein
MTDTLEPVAAANEEVDQEHFVAERDGWNRWQRERRN